MSISRRTWATLLRSSGDRYDDAGEPEYRRASTMGWASGHIERLRQGGTVSFRPRGNSMSPKIESGQLCTVAPVDPSTLVVGDIVLCKVRGSEYLHFIKAIQGGRFQIGNNHGFINGWIGANAVYGRLLSVEP